MSVFSNGGFKSGFLNKASMRTGKNWQKRFGVLSGCTLSYYESDSKRDLQKSKGDLLIDAKTVLRTAPADNRNLCLYITLSPSETLIGMIYFQCLIYF